MLSCINGYLRVRNVEGGGFDSNGNPIAVTPTTGEAIPCNFQRDSYDKGQREEGGEFSGASYTILIEEQPFEPCQFILYDRQDNELGTFLVQRTGIVHLTSVHKIEITT